LVSIAEKWGEYAAQGPVWTVGLRSQIFNI
jgi:hypothetical protein